MARLHRDRTRRVLDRVLAGEFAADQLWRREVDLAQGMGVSRGVAREVIRAMEERGVVSVKHGALRPSRRSIAALGHAGQR